MEKSATAVLAGRKVFFNFLLANALSGIVRGTTMFVVNLYAIHLGANMLELGLLRAITGFSILVSVLPIGFLVDHYGARRLYLLGESCASILTLVLVFLTSPVALIIQGGFYGLSMALRFASMQSVLLEQLQMVGSGKAGWLRGSGFIGVLFIGPFFGALLVKYMSYSAIFIFLTVMSVLLVALSWALFRRESHPGGESVVSVHKSSLSHFMSQVAAMSRNKRLVNAIFSEGLNSACFSVFSVFIIAVALKAFDFTPQTAGGLISMGGATFLIAVFFGGDFMEKLSYKSGLFLSLGGNLIGLTFLASARSGGSLWAGAAICGLFMGLNNVVTLTQVSNVKGRKGQLVGFYNLSTSLGNTVGPMLGGMVGKAFGPQAVFFSFVPLVALIGLWIVLNTNPLQVCDE